MNSRSLVKLSFILPLIFIMVFLSVPLGLFSQSGKDTIEDVENLFSDYTRFVAEMRQSRAYHIFSKPEIDFFKKQSQNLLIKDCPFLRDKTTNPLLIYVQKSIPEGRVGFNDPIYYSFYPKQGFFYRGQMLERWTNEMEGQTNRCYVFGGELQRFLIELETKLNTKKKVR